MKTKICTHPNCIHQGNPQPLDNFHNRKISPDGKFIWCKDCKRKWSSERYQRLQNEKPPTLDYIYPELPPNTKVCSNANCIHQDKLQPVSNFYKASRRKDGYSAWCIDCKKAWVTKYRKTESNRKSKQKYDKSGKGVASRKRQDRKNAYRYKVDPEYRKKVRARNNVSKRVFKGTMPPAKDFACVECSNPANQYHHHNGYEKEHWYDVVPVCFKCHPELEN